MNGHAVKKEESDTKPEKPGVFYRLIKAFSLYETLPKLMDTTPKPNQLQGLDGIRFFSMTWVILGHVWSVVAQVGGRELKFIHFHRPALVLFIG